MLKGTRWEHGELLKQDVSAGTTDDPDGALRSVPRDGGRRVTSTRRGSRPLRVTD